MEKKYEVILTSKARDELDYIYNYISNSLIAKKAAEEFLNKLKNSILRLEIMPESCSIVNQISNSKKIYRKLLINNFIIIYRVDKIHKKVYIIKIVYNKMNYLKNLESF